MFLRCCCYILAKISVEKNIFALIKNFFDRARELCGDRVRRAKNSDRA